MTVTSELIPLPIYVPAVVESRAQRHPPGKHALPATWHQRIYRIPSQPLGEDFTYGADGFKRMKPSQGEHVDLYV
jgi:hypothetical protein